MDTINLQILEDGTITLKTSAISDGNHMSADALMEDFEKLLGGKVVRTKDPHKHQHDHSHTHAHAAH